MFNNHLQSPSTARIRPCKSPSILLVLMVSYLCFPIFSDSWIGLFIVEVFNWIKFSKLLHQMQPAVLLFFLKLTINILVAKLINLCMLLCLQVLPSSSHSVASTAVKFLMKWLYQYEHEYRQWTSALSLGLLSSGIRIIDSQQYYEIVAGLLEVILW